MRTQPERIGLAVFTWLDLDVEPTAGGRDRGRDQERELTQATHAGTMRRRARRDK